MDTPGTVVGGYRNEEDKRAYLLRAGVIGAVCLVAQIFAPMLFPLVAMPLMMSGQMTVTTDDAASAAGWKGRVAYIQTVAGTKNDASSFLRLVDASGALDERKIPLASRAGTLVAGGGKLWFAGREQVQAFDDVLASPTTAQGLEDGVSAAFYAGGALRAVSNAPDGLRFKTLTDGAWAEWFRVPNTESTAGVRDAVASGDTLHLFSDIRGALYHAVLPMSNAGTAKLVWGEIRGGCSYWQAYEETGAPAIACVRRDQGLGMKIELLRPAAAGWIAHRTFAAEGFAEKVAVIPADDGRGRLLLISGFPGGMTLYAADGDALVQRARLGSTFPFPKGMFLVMMVPYLGLIVLSFALAWLLDRHIATYRSSGDGREHSPLLRRAFAQVADSLILAAPMLVSAFFFFRIVTRGLNPNQMFLPFLIVGGQFVWMFAGLLAFAYAEGAWGTTPGKKLMGLRVVGIDGEPCGFGRALVRNVLKLADGFFNFNVGLLLAALTDTRQRLGDMAARTVVIRVRD